MISFMEEQHIVLFLAHLSRRLTGRAYRMAMLRRPSTISETAWQIKAKFEPRHEKTGFLSMRKQSRRSASQ